MTSSNGNIFHVTGHLCGEFTGPRWIPSTKVSDADLWCFRLICVWINGWMNNREAGDFRHYRAHYDVIVINDKSVIQGPLNEQSVMLTKRGIWVTRPGYGYALLFTHDTNCHWVGFFNSAQTPCNRYYYTYFNIKFSIEYRVYSKLIEPKLIEPYIIFVQIILEIKYRETSFVHNIHCSPLPSDDYFIMI